MNEIDKYSFYVYLYEDELTWRPSEHHANDHAALKRANQ
jgi:hypothetical protein